MPGTPLKLQTPIVTNLVTESLSGGYSTPQLISGVMKSITSVDSDGAASQSCTITNDNSGTPSFRLSVNLKPGQKVDLFKWRLMNAYVQTTSGSGTTNFAIQSYKNF